MEIRGKPHEEFLAERRLQKVFQHGEFETYRYRGNNYTFRFHFPRYYTQAQKESQVIKWSQNVRNGRREPDQETN